MTYLHPEDVWYSNPNEQLGEIPMIALCLVLKWRSILNKMVAILSKTNGKANKMANAYTSYCSVYARLTVLLCVILILYLYVQLFIEIQ